MTRVGSRLLLTALIAVSAPSATAQTSADSLTAGARVRLRAPESGIPWRSAGVLDSVSSDTLYLHGLHDPPALRDARLAVPVRHIEHMDVRTGRASRGARARRGALWGLGAYAVTAGAFIVHEKATCRTDCFGEGFMWLGLLDGIPVSAGIGAAIGFSLPVETWRPVVFRRR